MQQLMQWIGSKGVWNSSRFSDLPRLKYEEGTLAHHWCVVGGGLALVLSRASDTERSTRLAAAAELYEHVRSRLRQGRRPEPGASLMADVMHETAHLADPMTRASLGTCFRECLKQEGTEEDTIPATLTLASTTTVQPSRLTDSDMGALDDMDTQINSGLFLERSETLRHAVAVARTNFSDLK